MPYRLAPRPRCSSTWSFQAFRIAKVQLYTRQRGWGSGQAVEGDAIPAMSRFQRRLRRHSRKGQRSGQQVEHGCTKLVHPTKEGMKDYGAAAWDR